MLLAGFVLSCFFITWAISGYYAFGISNAARYKKRMRDLKYDRSMGIDMQYTYEDMDECHQGDLLWSIFFGYISLFSNLMDYGFIERYYGPIPTSLKDVKDDNGN
jgi:hypothetical protein